MRNPISIVLNTIALSAVLLPLSAPAQAQIAETTDQAFLEHFRQAMKTESDPTVISTMRTLSANPQPAIRLARTTCESLDKGVPTSEITRLQGQAISNNTSTPEMYRAYSRVAARVNVLAVMIYCPQHWAASWSKR